MGAGNSKTKETENTENDKSKNNNITSENNNIKTKSDKQSNKNTTNFQVEMFSENENDSKNSSKSNNNEDNDNIDNNNSEKGSSLVEVRIFDYSSSDSESSIDYEVLDLKKEQIPDNKTIKTKKPKNKKPQKNSPKKEKKEEKEEKEEKKVNKEEKNEDKNEEKKEDKKEEEKNEIKENQKEKLKKKKKKKKKKYESSDSSDNSNSDSSDSIKTPEKKKEIINKKIEIPIEEEESSEFESEKIDSPHPSQIIESNIKEIVYSEYIKNKKYYTPEEKKKLKEISKYDSCTRNKYRKNILLHEDEITSICALDSKTKSIAYATSSLDRTIKFWTGKFKLIDTISDLLTPSLYLCEFDNTNVLSAEGVYIKMYDLLSEIYECKFTFRDHIDEIYIIYVIITQYIMNFLSGGKDKIIRLWIPDNENPIRYYEGHTNSIINIKNISKNKKLIASISEDKKCIIWEVNNSNMLYEFDNYYTPISLIETKNGFCIGAYDNKIRFYNEDYSLKKCLKTKFYGNILLLGDDSNLFCADANGNINLIDLDNNEMIIVFEGNKSDIVQMIKSYNWDPEPIQKDDKKKSKFYPNKAEDRTIITVNKDGYVYTYKNELFTKMKIIPKEIFIKEEKGTDKNSKENKKSDETKKTEKKPKKILRKKDKEEKSTRKTVTFSNN